MPCFGASDDRGKPRHGALSEIGRQPARKEQRRYTQRGRRRRDIFLAENRPEIEGNLFRMFQHAEARASGDGFRRPRSVPEFGEFGDGLQEQPAPQVLVDGLRELREAIVQPPIGRIVAKQRRQDRLDQREAADAICERRIGGDLEGDGATVGVTDQVDRPRCFGQAVAQPADFLCQAVGPVPIAMLAAIAGNVGGNDPVVAAELFGEPGPLPARAERAVQGDHAARRAFFGRVKPIVHRIVPAAIRRPGPRFQRKRHVIA